MKTLIILFCLIGFANGQNVPFPFKKSNLIPDITDAYGVSWADLDNDGNADIYLTAFRGLNRVLLNNGKANFTDATIITGLGGNLTPRGIVNLELGNAVFDWDNDGDNDVLICGWGNSTKLYQNEGELKFIDITEKLNLTPPYDFNDAAIADVNNDGFPDLFLTDEHYPNRLLLNKGGDEFEDISSISGLNLNAISQTASFCDVDLDGDADLYVANWEARDWFFENLGDLHFKLRDISIPSCSTDGSSNSVSFADVDNDGDFDLFVAVKKGKNLLVINKLSLNSGPWSFEVDNHSELSQDMGNSYGGNFADINNDGLVDIFVTNRGENQFFINHGDLLFSMVYHDTLTPRSSSYSTGSGFADFDTDGDLDLLIANKDTISLLMENHSVQTHFIRFAITGVESNRNAIGTRILLYINNTSGQKIAASREISGGNAYLSQNEYTAHFGVEEKANYSCDILFPSGISIHLDNLKTDSTYTIEEMGSIKRVFYRFTRAAGRQLVNPVFWWSLFQIALFISISLILGGLGIKKYHWTAGTTAFLIGTYFVASLIISFISRNVSIIYLFSILNSFAILFSLVTIFLSKEAKRLFMKREEFREVLINASSKILDCRSPEEIINVFAENVSFSEDIDRCQFIPYDGDKNRFLIPEEEAHFIGDEDINQAVTQSAMGTIPAKKGRGKLYVVNCERGEKRFGVFLITARQRNALENSDIGEAIIKLSQHAAVSFQNIDNIKQTEAFIAKLTAAEVRKEYIQKLEEQNTTLNEKNKALTELFNQLKSTQSQLVLAEKMASLGRLVAGIAHELNNPISFIYANVNQMQKYVDRLSHSLDTKNQPGKTSDVVPQALFKEISEMIEETRQGSTAVKNLVENLRRFSHLDRSEWQLADIHQGIESCLMILKPEIKEGIDIHKDFAGSAEIECHPGQLNQVFLNILTNAVQAIKNKGNIQISTRDDIDDVRIVINDDGMGIPEEALANIFDPFYSSKDVGEGTGLGLSISRTIIENHHGTVEVESKAGQGSTFTITLPKRQAAK